MRPIRVRSEVCGKQLIPVIVVTRSPDTARRRFGGFPRCRLRIVLVTSRYAYQEAGWLVPANPVTFLLRLSAEEGVRAGMLAVVPVRSEILGMGTIEVLTRVSRKLSPVSEAFLGFLGTELAPGG
jgi:hypothetical protein